MSPGYTLIRSPAIRVYNKSNCSAAPGWGTDSSRIAFMQYYAAGVDQRPARVPMAHPGLPNDLSVVHSSAPCSKRRGNAAEEAPMAAPTNVRVILGYDGSRAATTAIDVGAALFPGARAWIAHLWTPPFASEGMRRRLWRGAAHIDDFVAAIEREGRWEAGRVAAVGTTLARAAGWDAEPLVQRCDGGEAFAFAQLATALDPQVVLVGSRGLSGARAVLGSVSDMAVHYSPKPVMVSPHPLLTAECAALSAGPVVIGWDGSAGARTALAAAERLFPSREPLVVSVGDGVTDQPALAQVVHLPADHKYGRTARSVADALAMYADRRGAALIVVGSRGRSAVQEIVLGSVAMATLHRAYRPVMVVPQTEVG
ncbi:universal stress protein [Dactylosporangium sp. NPDC049140]|uniref:universal stress protein n=1 Tax=Dactylosporangium sp. NPDC049140 TaxID=3155647 RepID=UPI0033C1728B